MRENEKFLSKVVGMLETPRLTPNQKLVLQRAAEASHVCLRLRTPGKGCVPVSIAFSHGSAILRKASIPLTITYTDKFHPAAKRIARIAKQRSKIIETQERLTNSDIGDFLQTQNAVWILTGTAPDDGHVFSGFKLNDGHWAIFDTASQSLADEQLAYNCGICDVTDVLKRAELHHNPIFTIVIYCFQNR
ncbi:MAG: hypothetical protein WAV56_01235 [Microgenomates group bacterium]